MKQQVGLDLACVTAAILAGGLGTRLRTVVADRPKVLAEVHGRPFVTYLLDQLIVAGVRDVVMCTGYRGEQVRARLGDAYGALRLAYSQESFPLGTAGALRLALPLVKSETVLVMNGDSWCDVNLRDAWAEHRARGASASLVVTEVEDTGRYGRVCLDAHGLVIRFEEKGAGTGWINAGLYFLSRRLLGTIPAGRPVSLEREMFPRWIGQGVSGVRVNRRFLDIGTPESYSMAERFFAQEQG
ncbi:MAG: nucleotidyltransferase family protein [Candidatus Latescibacteria bacterium]|nr:nucleotidyltransferase family protein [Candidatus Latescibacterota bacterium]